MRHNYLVAVLLGLLYYPLQQIIFWLRFGRLNFAFSIIDLCLPLTGSLAFLMLFFAFNTTQQRKTRVLLWVLFLLAIPCSLFGSLMGGLLGPVGIVVFGLVPILIVLLLGKVLGRWLWGK